MAIKTEGQFEWPSDDTRYKALSSAHPEVLGPQVKATTVPEDDLEIHNEKSYQVTFDNGPDDADDDQFWGTLFIGALDDKWQILDERVLRHRFSWVLKYIRTGALPAEAVFAQGILREALEGSVPACHTQYSYEIDVPTSRFLNPDLSQRWTEQFLTAHSDRVKLDAGLEGYPGGLSFPALCDRYGILIPQLWEEAALRFTLSIDPVSLVARSTNCNAPLALMNPATSVGSDLAEQRATLSGSLAAQQNRQENREEIGPDSTASGTQEISDEALYERETQCTGLGLPGPGSASQSTTARPSSKRKTRKSYSIHARLWTPDRRAYFESLIRTAEDWDDAIEKFEAKFGTEHSVNALGYQARRQGLDISRISRSLLWTREQEEDLALLLQKKPDDVQQAITDCVKQLNEKFNICRTYVAVHTKASRLGLIGVARQRSAVIWTAEELELLDELWAYDLRSDEVRDKFWDRFGTTRSHIAIGSKWFELVRNGGLEPTLSKDEIASRSMTWTPKEHKFIREWDGTDMDALADAFEAKFPHQRSRLAVRERWRTRDRRDPGATIKAMNLWTPAEDAFIKEWSGTVFSVSADVFHERFPGRRTTEALRTRRTVLRNQHSASTVKRCDTYWTPEEDAMIKEWPESEESSFFDAFNARFPHRRTENALKIRWEVVRGLQKKGDSEKWRCRWSIEEDDFIKKWPNENLRDCEVAFQQEFPGKRTRIAVRRRWDTLRAKKMEKGDTTQKAGSQWSPAEDELIRNWPNDQRSKCVAAFQKKFPNQRTDSAIKNRWCTLRNERKPQGGDVCGDEQ
ncbi:hypothetical protein DL764_010248 [Monosporascus ibericus]|uniref:Myb-like domain-containing protein n=1 Tax=Monosporascus ibericus TaxID=155417 RepID=A0A4Q4ST09_9PEZI|nr:hypothetical protein DL764_010248 [Monosporascus ibericus]